MTDNQGGTDGAGWRAVGRLAMLDPAQRRIVVHASESWFDAVHAGRFDFFTRLGARAAAEGVARLLIRAERPASARLIAEPGLHLLLGPRRPVGPGILHVHPGYLWGYWYLDPLGVNHASSIADEPFGGIDTPEAVAAMARLAGRLVDGNISKAPQAPRAALPPAAAAVFLQEIEHWVNPVHFIDTETILRTVAIAVARAGGGRVYVKLHPAQSAAVAGRVHALAAGLTGVEVTAASLHDIVAASGVIVTQSSAAGFEALLQRRAVITCGRTDYHHATLVARNPAQLKRALAAAPAHAASFPFAGYLGWFLAQQYESAAPDFPDRVWARCLATGALAGEGPATAS